MLPRSHLDRIQIAFDDHRLVNNAGLILPTTLAQHLGLPQLVDRHLDLGRAPGRANTGDKMMTLVASAPRFRGGRLWLAATALTMPTCCAPAGRPAPSAAWSRRRPPWAPSCAASGGATSASWTGWAASCWPGPGPLGPDPPTHHSPSTWTPPSARPTGWQRRERAIMVTPASGAITRCCRGRRHRRRADGPSARGPGQHRSGRRPLSAGDGGSGAPRRGQRTTHGAGRQRLLYQRHRRRLPQAAGAFLHHHPSAQEPAQSHRGDTRGCLDAHPLLDGRRRRRGGPATLPSRASPTPRRCGSSSGA